MSAKRKIIEIDEEKCNGCGQCILSCAEGALALVDGKAKLVGDLFCDGLGACIGDCPEDALKIVEREADEFDEAAVEERLRAGAVPSGGHEPARPEAVEGALPCGCPSSQVMSLEPKGQAGGGEPAGEIRSELGHWPIKLQLLGPAAPFLKGADLMLMADCVAVTVPDLHRKFLKGSAVAIGCPKLDDLEAHIQRLADILQGARPRSLTTVFMEVPCCHGFLYAAEEAIQRSGVDLPLYQIMIGRNGEILRQEEVFSGKMAQSASAPVGARSEGSCPHG